MIIRIHIYMHILSFHVSSAFTLHYLFKCDKSLYVLTIFWVYHIDFSYPKTVLHHSHKAVCVVQSVLD